MARTNPAERLVRPVVALAVLLGIGLVARIVFLVQLGRSGLGDVLVLDSRLYYDVAHAIATGGALPQGALTFNPLYPVFLAGLFRLFGEGLIPPRVVQLAVGLLTIALVYFAGLRLVEGPRKGRPSGEATAAVAVAMAVLYAQFVLYEGMILASSLEVFLLTASFLLALALDEHLAGERRLALGPMLMPPWGAGLLLGALCGAGALARPNLFLLLIAALPVWLLVRHRRKRRGLAPAACCLLGAALFVAPVLLYDAARTGQFVPITAHGGFNFYVGNGPEATGLYQPPADVRSSTVGSLEDAKTRAEAETGRRMTEMDASNYYVHKAVAHIAGDPGSWLRLLGMKLVIFLGEDAQDMPNAFLYENSCGILKLLFIPFKVIAPLAICGYLVLLRSRRNRGVVSVFLACALASVLLFYVNVRYRLPAVPIFMLLASFAVAWGAREVSRKRFRQVAIMTAAALALFFLVSSRNPVPVTHSASYAMLGNYYLAKGDQMKAADAFAEAYRRDPDKLEAMINYARALRQGGRMQEAADLYARSYERSPRFPLLAIEYGMALNHLGRGDEARKL
ncbi:MAG TPA: tetratricopeptide repeat protein, partial [Candidatus Bathyarchaeia archaeon]|nr:tetratricopeptide repeat protein [Candidatus Bathyarchaeia archaeon]